MTKTTRAGETSKGASAENPKRPRKVNRPKSAELDKKGRRADAKLLNAIGRAITEAHTLAIKTHERKFEQLKYILSTLSAAVIDREPLSLDGFDEEATRTRAKIDRRLPGFLRYGTVRPETIPMAAHRLRDQLTRMHRKSTWKEVADLLADEIDLALHFGGRRGTAERVRTFSKAILAKIEVSDDQKKFCDPIEETIKAAFRVGGYPTLKAAQLLKRRQVRSKRPV